MKVELPSFNVILNLEEFLDWTGKVKLVANKLKPEASVLFVA